MTSLVRRCEPCRIVLLLENILINKAFSESNNINIEHDVNKYLEEMIPILAKELKFWKRSYEILIHKVDGNCISNITGYESIHTSYIVYYLHILSK